MSVEQARDQRGARYCTVLYVEAPDLTDDLSQYNEDLFSGPSVWFESATERLDGTGRRTLRFRLQTTGGAVGTLWRHGTGAATERLLFDPDAALVGLTTLVARLNDVDVVSWSPATLQGDFVGRLAWVTVDNPESTGASDEMLSWLLVEDTATGETDALSFTHPRKLSAVATACIGASDETGALPFSGTLDAFGYDRDAATLSVLEHDWGTVVADGPATDDELTMRPIPPLPWSSGAGSAGEFFGVAPQWAGTNHHRSRRRSFSPLVNERFPEPVQWRDGAFSSSRLVAPAPDGSGFWLLTTTLRARVVSDDANVAWVRAHLHVHNLQPAPDIDVTLRCYSFDRDPLSPLVSDWRFISETRSTSSTPGHALGELLPLARSDGMTWLVLALQFDPDAVSTEAAVAVLSDWHVLPRSVLSEDGGVLVGGGFV